MTVANGQFLIIKRSAYEAIGGHKSVKSEVLDDLMLARRLVESGFTGSVAEASEVASCQMYKTSSELITGYRKSLWKAFGGVTGSIIAILLLLITGVLPFIAALLGSEIGVISFILIVISRVISSIRTGTLPNTSLLHPLAIIFSVIHYLFMDWQDIWHSNLARSTGYINGKDPCYWCWNWWNERCCQTCKVRP